MYIYYSHCCCLYVPVDVFVVNLSTICNGVFLLQYFKQRILHFHLKGYRAPTCTIQQIQYCKEEIKYRCRRISNFLQHFQTTALLFWQPGSGRLSKITQKVKEFLKQKMREDNETTAHQLHKMLRDAGYDIHLSTILHWQISLGWTFRSGAYCQTIREANMQTYLNFTQKYWNDGFGNVLKLDKCTVWIKSHEHFAAIQKKEKHLNLTSLGM